MDLIEAQYSSSITVHHPWEIARITVVYNLIKKNLPELLLKDCIIADIGCGDVFLIEQLSKLLPHAKFIAIDIGFTDELINILKQKLTNNRISIYKSLEDANKEIRKPVDLVLLLDVVEHVENESAFFRNICTNLFINETTKFCITVPAFQSLFISRDIFLKHYRRYNKKRLKQTIEFSNLELISNGYFFFSLLPIRTLQMLSEFIFKPDPNKIKGIGGRKENIVLDNIIKSVLILDFKISVLLRNIGITLPGLSVFTIARYKK